MPLTWTKETGGIGNVAGSIQSSPVIAQQILAINDVLPFSIKAKAASVLDLTRWLDSNGNIVARVTYLGELVVADSTFTFTNTGLKIRDTDASHTLQVSPGSNLTANRVFTLTTGDADRTLTLSGNPTIADWFDQSVKIAASPTHVALTLSQATGTAPMTISSTTVVTNLNADLVDGVHGTAMVQTSRLINTTLPLAGGGSLSGDLTLTLGGLTTIGAANQGVGVNAAGTAWEYKSIVGTASEIDITHTANQIQIGLVNPLSVPKGGTGLAATTANQLLYSSANDVVAGLASANSGVLVTSGAGVPSISTDLPTAATIGGGYIYRVGGSDVGLADGGTNAGLTASNGGIVYSTATQLAILAATVTANQTLLSGSSAAPAWSTATYPPTTTINQLLYSSAANTIAGLATGNNGVLITSGAGVPSISSTIPAATQANITALGTIATGVWNGTAIGVAYGGTGVATFAANGVLYGNNATSVLVTAQGGADTVLTANAGAPSFSGQPSLATGLITKGQNALQLNPYGAATGNTGEVRFLELAANGTSYVGFKAQDALAGNVIWQLPLIDGSAGQFLKTSGAGVLSFDTVSPTGFTSRVSVTNNAQQSGIVSATFTKVAFQTETFDGNNEFDNVTNYRFTAGSNMYVHATACIRWGANFAGNSLVYIYKNGAADKASVMVEAASGAAVTASVSDTIYLATNDYLEVFVYQSSGSDKTIPQDPVSTFFSVIRLS